MEMKKQYVIKELVQKSEDGSDLYFLGHYTSGDWGKFIDAKFFDTEQEAIWKIADLGLGYYQVIEFYH